MFHLFIILFCSFILFLDVFSLRFNNLYVWDEPLNFIDVYSRMQIEQLITEFAPTMLLVEHDSVFRDTVASKIVNI